MRDLAMVLLAAISIVGPGTESRWAVTKGATPVGTITLLTSDNGARAEWKATVRPATIVFLGSNGGVWLRTTGGDVQLSTVSASGVENAVTPALLLPFTTSPGDAVASSDGKATSYAYRGAKAS